MDISGDSKRAAMETFYLQRDARWYVGTEEEIFFGIIRDR